PFVFVFNQELLLMNVTPLGAVFVFIKSVIAMLLFAAATQGFFMTKSRRWESAALLLVTAMLLRPGFFLDFVQPPYERLEAQRLFEVVEQLPDDAHIRVLIRGPSFENPDQMLERRMAFNLGEQAGDGATRFEQATSLPARIENGTVILDEPLDLNSLTGRTLSNMDFYADQPVQVTALEVPAERMPKEIFYLPAVLILGLVGFLQRRRGGTLAGNPLAQ